MIYEILEAGSAQELARLVNIKSDDGWQPQGGVCVHQVEYLTNTGYTTSAVTQYAQAIVKQSAL